MGLSGHSTVSFLRGVSSTVAASPTRCRPLASSSALCCTCSSSSLATAPEQSSSSPYAFGCSLIFSLISSSTTHPTLPLTSFTKYSHLPHSPIRPYVLGSLYHLPYHILIHLRTQVCFGHGIRHGIW